MLTVVGARDNLSDFDESLSVANRFRLTAKGEPTLWVTYALIEYHCSYSKIRKEKYRWLIGNTSKEGTRLIGGYF